jgi:DNA-binding response OmpR family regulator
MAGLGGLEVQAMNATTPARPRLLLLEDDRATYTALKRVLALRGWDVILTTTVAEAREALDEPLDAAVLDLMLPDGAGDDLVQELRTRSPDMPIAVTTGVSDADRLALIHLAGPTVLLRKPIALPDLLKAIAAPVRLA